GAGPGAAGWGHLDRLAQLARRVRQLAGPGVHLTERRGGAAAQLGLDRQRLAERAPGLGAAGVQVDGATERRHRLVERAPPRAQLAEREERLGRLRSLAGDLEQLRLGPLGVTVGRQRARPRHLVGDGRAPFAGQLVERPRDAIEDPHQGPGVAPAPSPSGAQTFWRISAIRSSIALSAATAASIPAALAVVAVLLSAARRSTNARSSTSAIPRASVSPAWATNSSRRAPNPSTISSSLGPTSAATRSTASGACALASAFTWVACLPRRRKARIGTA